jgi:hypothetical protein
VAQCIYCPNEADAREHWIPRGFGNFRGYSPLLDRLCERCNRELGHELDEELLRTGPVAFNRAVLGVRGRRRHTQVNPFLYRGASADPPTTLRMMAIHGEYEILAEAYRRPDGTEGARYLRQIVVRKDGAIHRVPWSAEWNGDQLRAALVNRNLHDAELVEIYLGEGEGLNPSVRERYSLRCSVSSASMPGTVSIQKRRSAPCAWKWESPPVISGPLRRSAFTTRSGQ